MENIRVRFAPSPTGTLHIGGARTALYNWLLARHFGGTFILRIEDTDVERSTEESIQVILDAMKWLGLDWDEGPGKDADRGPYFQSQRRALYLEHLERLKSSGLAYPCSCSPEELDQMREEAMAKGEKPKYNGTCREGQPPGREGRSVVWRLKAPLDGHTVVKDRIKKKSVFANDELDDLVLLRTDGTPTYNFCCVVDDAAMGITHVIRGDDHLNNTPKQILLYQALGYPVPEFAHVPMILGADRKRLSKRHGATGVLEYQKLGYLPWALCNYLVRLGWSHGDQELFSREELAGLFTLEGVGRSASVFNPEKLDWVNAQHIQSLDDEFLGAELAPFLEERGYETANDTRLPEIAKALKQRSKTMKEMAQRASYFFTDDIEYDEKAFAKFIKAESIEVLSLLRRGLAALDEPTEAAIEELFRNLAEETGLKLGKIAQPTRVALTGGTASPGIFEVVNLLGLERALKRLDQAILRFEEQSKSNN